MQACHQRLRIAIKVVESQRERTLDQAVDRQRPLLPIDTRNTEMTKDDGVFVAGQAVAHLVRRQRNTPEKA
jgi:hypothetical protein